MPIVEPIAEPCIEECDLSFVLIGDRLRELREARELSSRHFQELSGISRFQTSRIEHGHGIPEIETLKQYATALEVPVSALLYDGDRPQAGCENLRSLSAFANVYSRMTRSERNFLRSIALRMRRKGVQATTFSAVTS